MQRHLRIYHTRSSKPGRNLLKTFLQSQPDVWFWLLVLSILRDAWSWLPEAGRRCSVKLRWTILALVSIFKENVYFDQFLLKETPGLLLTVVSIWSVEKNHNALIFTPESLADTRVWSDLGPLWTGRLTLCCRRTSLWNTRGCISQNITMSSQVLPPNHNWNDGFHEPLLMSLQPMSWQLLSWKFQRSLRCMLTNTKSCSS